ncbi:MAG: fructosamine kinase, partial [Bacteroidetes bacterium]
MILPEALKQALSTELGASIYKVSAVGGGCIHNGRCLETGRGTFFLKYNHLDQGPNFAAEARGLA